MEIKKVIIPAAGWGTRFLPQTKAMPKEMLPIVDKPVIQHVVEEAVSSGVKDIVIITGWHKRAIEDHFDRSLELEKHLINHGKKKELVEIKKIANMANFIYVRQKGEIYGNAVPVLASQPVIGNEPFAVMWGDEFFKANPPRLRQLLDVYKKHNGIIISAMRIKDKKQISRYGIADVTHLEKNVFKLKKIVEKPSLEKAPSDLGALGAYILPPKIFEVIKKMKAGKGGEIWLIDAINHLIKKGVPAYCCEIKNGKYYDTGNKLEYLKTVIDFGLSHPETSEELKKYLKEIK